MGAVRQVLEEFAVDEDVAATDLSQQESLGRDVEERRVVPRTALREP